jgi:hypothetical protein
LELEFTKSTGITTPEIIGEPKCSRHFFFELTRAEHLRFAVPVTGSFIADQL